jgi:hypothetical protein
MLCTGWRLPVHRVSLSAVQGQGGFVRSPLSLVLDCG